MLILLSSSMRDRYRDDILRCLAMPEGTSLQFRYSSEIVEPAIWSDPHGFEGQGGLVCSVDLSVMERPCTLLPVRHVTVTKIFKHGTTLSVMLQIGKLACVESLHDFTNEINGNSSGKVPANRHEDSDHQKTDAKATTGYFFFNGGSIGLVSKGESLEVWEGITAELYKQPEYDKEPLFWTLLALRQLDSSGAAVDRDRLLPWAEDVRPGREYSMVVYVFHPLRDRWSTTRSRLRLTSRPPISTSYPLDQVIDSPYDTKEWRFRIQDPGLIGPSRGWFRLGATTSGDENNSPRWEIDLPISLKFSWGGFWATTLLLGILVAAPGVIGVWLKAEGRLIEEILATIAAVVLGTSAAMVAAWRIPKRI